jgi:hypothetical protein
MEGVARKPAATGNMPQDQTHKFCIAPMMEWSEFLYASIT